MSEYAQILDSVRALARDEQPSGDISRLLYEHRCYYLLSKIKAANVYTKKYKAEAAFHRLCVFQRYQAVRGVLNDIEKTSIPYALVKGAVLSTVAYGNPYARHSGDIDLLIRRSDIDEVKQLLLNQGFVQGRVTANGVQPFSRRELLFQTALSHQAAPFVKDTGHPLCPCVNVDVNMDILWGESGRQSDMDFVLAHMETVDICGITVQKLSREMEFIALCLHHYKDMNSLYLLAQGSLKLSLFCDIYFYIKRCRPDISKMKALCGRLDVLDYVYYCVYYTGQVFDDPMLSSYQTALEIETSESILPTFGLAEDERHEWDISFSHRIFDCDISDYFHKKLSRKAWEKIHLNAEYM